jgi:hypothetical protein
MAAVQAVLDILGPFTLKSMRSSIATINPNGKLDVKVLTWLVEYREHHNIPYPDQ